MFKSALLKLTLWYLLIVMILSIGFSLALYSMSLQELDRGLTEQSLRIKGNPYFKRMPDYMQQEELNAGTLAESRRSMQTNLFLINLAVLLAGGAVSYLLARRTLLPIEQALESQNRFTADASHELRTPLTAMRTEIEVSLRDERLSLAEAKGQLKSNLEEIQHLEALSSSLLKLAGGVSELDPKLKSSVSLSTIVEGAVAKLEKPAQARQISISTEVDPGVIKGDQHSLIELLVILLDNAIKYSHPGGSVLVRAYMDSKHAVMEVHDKGIGMKESDIPHVFERFYRADHSRSKYQVEGYGLGLSIAQKIVQLHGGSLKLKSQLGKGSTFVVAI